MADRHDTLSKLYTRLIDSRDGYKEAMEDATSPTVKGTLNDMAERRTRDAAELRSFLAREGVELDDDGSLLAAAHRTFMNMKDAVTGTDDKAIMQEILRGEKSLHEQYHDAMEKSGPSHPEYAILKAQHDALYEEIQRFEARSAA